MVRKVYIMWGLYYLDGMYDLIMLFFKVLLFVILGDFVMCKLI